LLKGVALLDSKPAGIASMTTVGMARFQSTVLASRMGSLKRSGGTWPGMASAEYTSCGSPHVGQ